MQAIRVYFLFLSSLLSWLIITTLLFGRGIIVDLAVVVVLGAVVVVVVVVALLWL